MVLFSGGDRGHDYDDKISKNNETNLCKFLQNRATRAPFFPIFLIVKTFHFESSCNGAWHSSCWLVTPKGPRSFFWILFFWILIFWILFSFTLKFFLVKLEIYFLLFFLLEDLLFRLVMLKTLT